mmetsp:Transcript_18852/g.19116  ORF Transcript_18852/g.19116 Transcript_18852/m.19116 type:complete len:91 (-) Transcript_18852:39-311(-)
MRNRITREKKKKKKKKSGTTNIGEIVVVSPSRILGQPSKGQEQCGNRTIGNQIRTTTIKRIFDPLDLFFPFICSFWDNNIYYQKTCCYYE